MERNVIHTGEIYTLDNLIDIIFYFTLYNHNNMITCLKVFTSSSTTEFNFVEIYSFNQAREFIR